MLNRLLTLSSIVNILGGAVLFFTWAANWATDPGRHVPIIVLAIGGTMIIQGVYSVAYALGWLDTWGEVAAVALLAGQLICGCVGLAMLVNGVISNSQNADQEMAPVLAGFLIATNSLIALVCLIASGKNPMKRSRGARA